MHDLRFKLLAPDGISGVAGAYCAIRPTRAGATAGGVIVGVAEGYTDADGELTLRFTPSIQSGGLTYWIVAAEYTWDDVTMPDADIDLHALVSPLTPVGGDTPQRRLG